MKCRKDWFTLVYLLLVLYVCIRLLFGSFHCNAKETDAIDTASNNIVPVQVVYVSLSENKVDEYYKTPQCTVEWFESYKDYTSKCDPPESIYDYYTPEEVELLSRLVEAEATGCDFKAKCNVASVLHNRLNSVYFSHDVYEMVYAPKQFVPVSDGRLYTVEVTKESVLAVEYAYMVGSTAQDALFFESGTNTVHDVYATRRDVEDSAGHRFYGIDNE